MSDVLSKARAHFSNMQRAAISVPEWGEDGEPATFYAPALSMANRQTIERRSKGDGTARLALTVILFLQNEDGTRAFGDDAATRRAFDMEIDPDVIARVAKAILRISDEDDLGN